MGALFLADYLALRAQEYGWLARMDSEWEGGGGGEDGEAGALGMLPNYAFSLALAAFRQEQDVAGDSQSCSAYGLLWDSAVHPCARQLCPEGMRNVIVSASDSLQLAAQHFHGGLRKAETRSPR